MADEWYGTLQHEFNAHEGSFLLQLRTELVWDKVGILAPDSRYAGVLQGI